MINWEWFDEDNCLRLLIYLIISVNYEDKKWRGNVIKKGQIACSLAKLSESNNMSVQTLRTTLNRLEDSGEVTLQSTSKFTIITLVKWDKMQQTQQATNKQLTNNQQTTNKQSTKTKEVKKERNKENKKNITKKSLFNFRKSLIQLGVEEIVAADYMLVRKNKKATNSETAFNALKKQMELSNLSNNEIIKICAENSWSGFKSQWLKNLNSKNNNQEIPINQRYGKDSNYDKLSEQLKKLNN